MLFLNGSKEKKPENKDLQREDGLKSRLLSFKNVYLYEGINKITK